MRKIWILALSALAVLASCTREEAFNLNETPEDDVLVKEKVTFTASLPAQTKTALGVKDGDSWPNYWCTGDVISVNGVNSEALDASFNGLKSAKFTVDGVAATYNAGYPASAFSAYSAGTATVTVPAAQTYVAGSYDPAAYVMLASSGTSTLSFQPQMAIFKLTPTGSKQIVSVSITALGSVKLAGQFSTDFSGLTPGAGATSTVTVTAASPVDAGTPWFIVLPAVDLITDGFQIVVQDNDGGSMTRQTKPSKVWAAGKMYSAEIPYTADAFSIAAEGITSSTAVICITGTPADEYKVSVYSDSGCSSLVDTYTIPAGAECWGGASPRFCVSGLAPGTTYYVKVSDVTSSKDSSVLPVTTAAFDIVEVSSTPANVDDVILAEDFGELRWDSELITSGVGYFPTSQDSFDNTEVGSFLPIDTNSEKTLGSQTTALTSSRLAHWAQGANNNLYIHPGYIKLVGSKKVTHLVTPALDNIPEGKLATLEVEVTACPYYSGSSGSYATMNAIVAVQPAGSYRELGDDPNTNDPLDLSTNIQPVTLDAVTAWKTYKVTLTGVGKGARLAFGAAAEVTQNNARMNISDMKVTIKALEDPALVASVKAVSSSTAAFTWTYGGEAAADIAKPYTIALYSDSACSNLVVSYSIDAGHGCWNSKTPSFSFSGLDPDTEYWFVATDTDASVSSDPVSATTDAFTVVKVSDVIDPQVNDIILAEDFGEVMWGGDLPNASAGYNGNESVSNSMTSRDANVFVVGGTSTSECLLGKNVYNTDGVRLRDWALGRNNIYMHPGYLKLSTKSTYNAHIITPALTSLPAGMYATLEVTITAAGWGSNYKAVAAVQHSNAGDIKNMSESSGQTNTVVFDNFSQITLNGGTQKWSTQTITVPNVLKGDRIAIGSTQTVAEGEGRLMISDVEIKVKELISTAHASVDINDFATFKTFLTQSASLPTPNGTLTADIALTDEQEAEIASLYPVPVYDAAFDGGNFTISGLKKPLFNDLKGTVSNLKLNSTLNITDAQNKVGIFAKSAIGATLTECVSSGSITHASATDVDGDLIIGGLIGSISGSTIVACKNVATITNNATASGTACVGGLIGVADGANDLSGSSTAYNYNQGLIIEDSATEDVAVGGVCGYTFNSASNFNYCKSLAPDEATDYDDIEIRNNTKNKVYVGGIIGKSAVTSSMDYTYNSSDIKFTELKITETGQVFGGGIIGGWSASGEQTITGCENKGWVFTKASAGDLAVADSEAKPKYWSCFAGIAGMGAGTSENLGGGWNTITGKTFTNCTNTGTVRIYAALRSCIAGVVAYTENNPDGCVSTAADIRPYLTGGISQVGDNYHRNICGGVVGLCTASKVSNLKSTAKIVSQSSSPFAYTGGILGYVPAGTIELENCKVSNHVQATGSGDGRSALMCHVAKNAVTVTFTNCVVKNGTISYSTGKKVTISDSNLSAQHCVGSGSNYTIVNDVLPAVADSID